MQVLIASESDREAWDGFLRDRSEATFMQDWQWGAVQKASGWRVWRLLAREAGEIVGVCLVVERWLPFGLRWLYVPWGPVFSSKQQVVRSKGGFDCLRKALFDLAKKEGAVFVRVEPRWEDGLETFGDEWKKADRDTQPRDTLVVDLGQTEEELLAGMKSKTRYNVRLADKKGVTVRFSRDAADLDVFWELAAETTGRSGFSYHPKLHYEAILKEMDAELAIAEYDGQALAVHLVVYAHGVATYVHGASASEQRHLMGPPYLYWRMMLRARERGMKIFDFFGVAPVGAGSEHAWAGITRMKEGFGGRRERFVGAYDLVVRSYWYGLWKFVQKVKLAWPKF